MLLTNTRGPPSSLSLPFLSSQPVAVAVAAVSPPYCAPLWLDRGRRSALPEGGLTAESKRAWGLEVTPRADFPATGRPPNPKDRGFNTKL